MSGVHLIAVDEQKVYTVNADAGVVVPEDGQSYSVSQAIYAAVFSKLENLDGARLDPGDYSVVLTCVCTRIEDQETKEVPLEDENQLEIPFDELLGHESE